MARSLTRPAQPILDAPAAKETKPIRVAVWPHWLDNPYLPNMINGLRGEGLEVSAPHILSIESARLHDGDWLHLHWSTEAHTSHVRWIYEARAAAFNRQLHILKRRGVRIAWTAHNLVPHDDPHPELGRSIRKDLLTLVDHVFIHFPSAQETLAKEFGYTGPCTVVRHPHYIDSHPTPPSQLEARTKLGLPIDGFVALSFGLLRPYKGISDIIHAFQKVAREQDRLILAGNPQGDVSADLALAREDPRILVCAKRIPKSDVPLYFAAADGAVIAHRGFFTSGSALLALSMGCPVIGPEVNHLVDLAGGQRLYPVELGVDGLAVGLTEARDKAGSVDRESMRDWAGNYSNWSEAAARTAAVFRDRSYSH